MDAGATLRGAAVGAGYFSQFHYDAWNRIEGAKLTALCDTDVAKARETAERYGIPHVYADPDEMLDAEQPDFLDIITPPATHLPLVEAAARRGVAVVCQKPLAPSLDEATTLVETTERRGIRLMVHENFRWQPWHRAIKTQLYDGAIGTLHAISIRSRTGDGWQKDAYLARQPYFRTMPRLLVYETGVHFLDLMRFFAGDFVRVMAWLTRRNPAISGEDSGLIIAEMTGGVRAVWDADRYAEPLTEDDPRYTFGEFLLEGDAGRIHLEPSGRLTVKRLGEAEKEIFYPRERHGFAGDCVHATLTHFITCLRSGAPFETDGRDYLITLSAQEAVYRSADEGQPVLPVLPVSAE
jgi:predicted dehydrogenase